MDKLANSTPIIAHISTLCKGLHQFYHSGPLEWLSIALRGFGRVIVIRGQIDNGELYGRVKKSLV